jgi:hypothetical protein
MGSYCVITRVHYILQTPEPVQAAETVYLQGTLYKIQYLLTLAYNR